MRNTDTDRHDTEADITEKVKELAKEVRKDLNTRLHEASEKASDIDDKMSGQVLEARDKVLRKAVEVKNDAASDLDGLENSAEQKVAAVKRNTREGYIDTVDKVAQSSQNLSNRAEEHARRLRENMDDTKLQFHSG